MTPSQLRSHARAMNGGRQYGSLTRLADKIGVHPATVTRWSKGFTPIPKLAETAITATVAYELAEARLSAVYDSLGL